MSRKLELIVLAILLIFAAQFFYISSTTDAEYGGADDKPEGVIEEITGGAYKPIAEPIWEPPSGEIESLLFALQAAIGAGIIGYFFGYYRAKNRFENRLEY
jgi:cobalt/nickel transport protein